MDENGKNGKNSNTEGTPAGKTDKTVPEITSIADEEALTEIDLGSFLADSESEEVVYDGFHEDIERTEQSLVDELDSLYDEIMSSGPATVVPKKLEELTVTEDKGPDEWMSPEEYLDIPAAPAAPAQPVTAPAADTPAADTGKDDILEMIETMKSDADGETGFDDILSEIEANEKIAPVLSDLSDTSDLTSDYVPEPDVVLEPEEPAAPAAPARTADDFDAELAELLGITPAAPASPADTSSEELPDPQREKPEFVVNIPDESSYEPAYGPDLTPAGQRTVGVEPVEIIEDNGKISRKEKKQAKLEAKGEKKSSGTGDIVRKIVLAVSIIVIIVSSAILVNTYVIEPYSYKKNESVISDHLENDATGTVEETPDAENNSKYPAGMLAKYKKLFDINSDLRGWVSIPALEINLPIAQAKDNDYYLHRNIYKKRTNYGVPFFDYRIEDFKNLPTNTVVYGHNMHYDDYIFGLLENYRDISGFKNAPVIECNTIYGDYTWFVYAAFITNSAPGQDNGYVFPYNFIEISRQKFAEYINEIDKRKFYTTGVDLQPGDKILTLSTCCYDFDGGRLVVVARLRREGEPSTVDTSRAVLNNNPKYPQAWYDANKKTNPYFDDARW